MAAQSMSRVVYRRCSSLLLQNNVFYGCQNASKRWINNSAGSYLCSQVKSKENYVKRQKLLSDLFGVSEKDAEKVIKSNEKVMGLDELKLDSMAKVLKRLDLNIEDVVRYPEIISHSPGAIEQHYNILRELGFENVSVYDLLNFNDVLNREIRHLRWNPFDSLLSYVDGPPDLKSRIIEKHPDLATHTIRFLHRAVILEYLTWRLGLDHQEVLSMVAKYPTIGNRSLSTLKQIFSLLTEDIGIPIKKIHTNAYLLIILASHAERLLSEMPMLAGVPIRQFLIKYPRLLSLVFENIQEANEHFTKFGVTDAQIFKCGNIYCLAASTIEERLKLIHSIPELANFKSEPRFLSFIYFYHSVIRRLNQLKNLNAVQYLSLPSIVDSEKRFRDSLERLNETKVHEKEIIEYLSSELGLDQNVVLQKSKHARRSSIWLSVNKRNLQKTLKLLLSIFTRDEVIKNLNLVFFDVSIIKSEMKELEKSDQVVKIKKLTKNLASKFKIVPRESDSEMKFGRQLANEEISVDTFLLQKTLYGNKSAKQS